MDLNRRKFLQISGFMAAGSLVTGLVSPGTAQGQERAIPGVKDKAMLNDSSRCIGCLSCVVACKKTNKLPDAPKYSPQTGGNTWTTVKAIRQENRVINTKFQCMHCTEASCISACPTGAAFKREDGIVLIDQETCVGCGYCVVACPFNVPGKSNETGTARKCTFCQERMEKGQITACAEACPAGAILFGDSAELLAVAEQRAEYLKSNGLSNATVYGENELGGLKVFYVLPEKPEITGFSSNPKVAGGNSLLKWATGLTMAGYIVVSPLRKMFEDKAGNNSVSGKGGGD